MQVAVPLYTCFVDYQINISTEKTYVRARTNNSCLQRVRASFVNLLRKTKICVRHTPFPVIIISTPIPLCIETICKLHYRVSTLVVCFQ